MPKLAWENRARAKRASLCAAVPPRWRLSSTDILPIENLRDVTSVPRTFLTEVEVTITESKPLELLANIHLGIWSAERVMEAFCHRAAIAHQLVNCLTEILFDNAIQQARELDQHWQATGALKGPLHGLPVSFMDRFRIAGAETGAGYIGWLGLRETLESESLLVQQMRSLGAIPFCKTNMPMSMMLAGTSNNIYGSTNNPYVKSLSSGGAAGGEGALVALRGSPLGWATEIAGSARIPAAFNGLYSLRVSTGRLSTKGIASSTGGVPICDFGAAPITSDITLLRHVMKCLISRQSSLNDHALLDLPWRVGGPLDFRLLSNDRPTFAILWNDGTVLPHPPIQRAQEMVVQALQLQGYETIDWNPPSHASAVRTLFEILGADGAHGIRAAMQLSGEPPVPELSTWYFGARDVHPLSTNEFWQLCARRTKYQEEYQEYWNSTKALTSSQRPVDGVIMPVAPTVALQDGGVTYFAYSAVANLLDFSAGSFPVTLADKTLDLEMPGYQPIGNEDKTVWEKYDADIFHGAPVGLQVMCRKLQEEKVLDLIECIVSALTRVRA